MKQLKSTLANLPLQDKRVLVRADLNVSIKNNHIMDDYKLRSIVPTINLIQQHGGKIILLSHMGRPKNHEPELSLKQLIPWFQNHKYKIDFATTLDEALIKSKQHNNEILLVENMRFFPGEKTNDTTFAQQLAQLGDFYVQDGFGVLHRKDTSVTDVPLLFAPNKRTIGLLVEKELNILNQLLSNPKHPFIFILGGAKIATKIPLLKKLLTLVDTILLCPAIVFTFLKARGIPVGKSLVDDTMLATCKTILQDASRHNVDLVFPLDYQVAYQKIDGELSIVDSDKISENDIGISIGPKTTKLFSDKIKSAKTIFLNGAIGFLDKPGTLTGMTNILDAMEQTKGTTIICGGDTTAVAHTMNKIKNIDYVLSGGGAVLAYLSGESLPGLTPFQD